MKVELRDRHRLNFTVSLIKNTVCIANAELDGSMERLVGSFVFLSISMCNTLFQSKQCGHFPGQADGVEVVLALPDEGVVRPRKLQRLHLRVELHAAARAPRTARRGEGVGVEEAAEAEAEAVRMRVREKDVGGGVGRRDADRGTPAHVAHCSKKGT